VDEKANCASVRNGFTLENRCIRRLWIGHPGPAMKRFAYLRDRLFLWSCAGYALNRWLLKPHFHSRFLHDHFNDVLLMPCALPVLLLLHRKLGLRTHDDAPTLGEITLNLAVWSILFEVIGPRIMPWTVGDFRDVVSYVVGGIAAGLWWHRSALYGAIQPSGDKTSPPLAQGRGLLVPVNRVCLRHDPDEL